MLFLEQEVHEHKEKQKGQKGGLTKKNYNERLRRENINNDFMYINYEI